MKVIEEQENLLVAESRDVYDKNSCYLQYMFGSNKYQFPDENMEINDFSSFKYFTLSVNEEDRTYRIIPLSFGYKTNRYYTIGELRIKRE